MSFWILLNLYDANQIIYIIINSFGTISAVLGNMLIFGAIICTKELQTMTSMIIFNLSLADLVVGALVNTFATIGVVSGESFFKLIPNLCYIFSSICFVSCFVSFINMALLSFNRYIYVCKNDLYATIFSTKKTFFYCGLTWLIGLTINLKSFTMSNSHCYDTKMLACMFNRKLNRTYTQLISLIFLIMPTLCLTVFYIKIFKFTLKSKSRIMSYENNKRLQFSFKISFGLFGSLFLFTLSALPIGLILMFDYDDKLPSNLYLYAWAMFRLNSSLNPILYGLSNSQFKKGYRNLFNIMLCRPKSLSLSSKIYNI